MSFLISVLLAFKTSAGQIIAATFAVAGTNASFAIQPYLRQHKPSFRDYVVFALPAAIGSVCSYLLIGAGLSNHFLGLCLTGFMLIAGIFLRANAKKQQKQLLHMPEPLMGVLSFLAGCIIGVFGGGGAIFITLGLVVLFGIQYHRALMLSLLITVFTCGPLLVFSYMKGNLVVQPILVILAVSVPCAFIAGIWANKAPEKLMKRLLGAYLILMSLYLFAEKI